MSLQQRLYDYISAKNVRGKDSESIIDETPFPILLDNNIETIIKNLNKRPWRLGEFKKQSWGIKLHSISSYVGRIKPAFAHWLIRICSKREDTVLDPFCGIGTIPLEGDILGRKAIGMDLNPYAVAIARAKFDRNPLESEISWLRNVKLEPEKVNMDEIPKYIRQYYHKDTLKEMFALKDRLIAENKHFLLGCLLGIAHGHRRIHLSIRTGYIIPYIPKPKPPIEYRKVIPRMIQKVKRMYQDNFPLKTCSKIYLADTRKMPLENDSTDIIISSPPYYHTIDYVSANKLRLAILGYEEPAQNQLKGNLIQQKDSYLREMKEVAHEIKRVLKPGSLCIFVLGDVHMPTYSINTAKDIGELYEKEGFKVWDSIPDEIPSNKTTIVKFGGEEAIKAKKKKMDRILIMQT